MACLLGVYYLILERQKMHRFNRFYLLGSLIFCIAVPFVNLPSLNDNALHTVTLLPVNVNGTLERKISQSLWPMVLTIVWIAVSSILLARFILNIMSFYRQVKNNETVHYKNATLVLLPEKVLPHTFLNYIFINEDDYANRAIEEELYTHELAHVNQKHTLDILFTEALKVVFWFNPLVYWYKKAIQLNHEFLADEKVVSSADNVIYYQKLLLDKASYGTTVVLASNLNFSITKKRLIMMTKRTPRFSALARQCMLVPVFGALVLVSCTKESEETPAVNVPSAAKPATDNSEVYNSANLTKQPEFPGGVGAFYSAVMKEFNMPEVNKDITAVVYLSFVVEKDGTVADIKVLRDPGHGLGDEALRVMESITTKWEPGEFNGAPVRTSFNLPIRINIKS
jgi:beta-lactamase regulating signal transducer with metallopeptidase domain